MMGMYLFVGLGNPGAEHAKQRHNIGFMAMDAIADAYDFSPWRDKNKGHLSEGRLGGTKILLLKPQTYMNLSGESVQPVVAFYKIPPDRIIVFHDELDLAAAAIKVKKGGGNAGHNGLKSISKMLGTDDYIRVRMGIDHPGDRARVNGHVLGHFREEEYRWLDPLLKYIAKYSCDLLHNTNDFTSKIMQDMKGIENV